MDVDMTTSTHSAPLTFGDTFTLPATGDQVWTIKDTRPPFAHLAAERRFTAFAKSEWDDYWAHYLPGTGWQIGACGSHDRAVVSAELAALNVDLPRRTAKEWQAKYRRLLTTETGVDIAQVVNLVDLWTEHTDLDQAPLRAHVAAVAACTAAGVEADPTGDLYGTVYAATLTAYRSA